jgi:hypothetical protein
MHPKRMGLHFLLQEAEEEVNQEAVRSILSESSCSQLEPDSSQHRFNGPSTLDMPL